MKTANRIEMMKGGRFISHHYAAEIYYDSRHRVIKTRMEGGGFYELVQEMQADASYWDEMLSIVSPSGEGLIIEYPRNQRKSTAEASYSEYRCRKVGKSEFSPIDRKMSWPQGPPSCF